jgi:hypothetical protein
VTVPGTQNTHYSVPAVIVPGPTTRVWAVFGEALNTSAGVVGYDADGRPVT